MAPSSTALPNAREIESSEKTLVVDVGVDADLPVFEDHFPGRPVVPGVMLVQWVFEFGRKLMPVHRAYTISALKFSRPVVPGRVYRLALTRAGSNISFRYECDGTVYSTGEISLEA